MTHCREPHLEWRQPLLGMIALLLVPLAATSHEDAEGPPGPFWVEPDYFDERVDVIAIMPVHVEYGLNPHDGLKADLEVRVSEEIEKAGFAVIGSSVYRDLWLDFAARVGGVYDRRSGVPDEKKYEVVREHTLRDLALRHQVDALLEIRLFTNYEVAPQRQVGGEPVTWMGKPLVELPYALRVAKLQILIWDTADRMLYRLWTPVCWTRIYWNQGYEERELHQAPDIAKQLDDAILGSLHYLTGGEWPFRLRNPTDWARREARPDSGAEPRPER